MAFGFSTFFIEELEANFGTYDPIGEAASRNSKDFGMHDSHQATKYFYQVPEQTAATRISGG